MDLLKQIKDTETDIQSNKDGLDFAEREVLGAQKKVEMWKGYVKRDELHLETLQSNYIDQNIEVLEEYHAEHEADGVLDDDMEKSFENWLENTSFEELKAIIEK